jgi:hypothetical protein
MQFARVSKIKSKDCTPKWLNTSGWEYVRLTPPDDWQVNVLYFAVDAEYLVQVFVGDILGEPAHNDGPRADWADRSRTGSRRAKRERLVRLMHSRGCVTH